MLRLIPLFDYQYTYDELSGLDRTQFNSFSELIEKGVKVDTHPALIQIFIYYLSKLFGYTTWVIKLPFLLCSFGVIIYGYIFGVKNFSKQVGIIVSLFFSFSLPFVYYAPIARMYVPGMFFSIALLYYFFDIFYFKNNTNKNYFLFGLFALLSALNQHLSALFAFTVCVSGLVYLSKNNYKKYLITCLTVILTYLPHLPITLHQLNTGGIGFDQGGWLPKPDISCLFSFLKVLLGTGRSYFIFFALILFAVVLNKRIVFNSKKFYLLVIFLINFFTIYVYSVYKAPLFQNSVMLFSAVALVIFISSFITAKNIYVFAAFVAIISGLFFYKTYFKKNYYEQSVANIFEYQFKRTAELKSLYGDVQIYPIYFDADTFMQRIYLDKYNTNFDCKISIDSVVFSLDKYAKFIANLKCNYIALGSSFPLFQSVTRQYFPYLIENTQTQGLNFKVYSKLKKDEMRSVPDDNILNYASIMQHGDYNFPVPEVQSNFLLNVDSLNEFPFGANAMLNKVTSREGQVVLLMVKIKTTKLDFKNVGVCISMNKTKNDSCVAYSAREGGDFIMNKRDSTITLYSDAFCGSFYNKIKNQSKLNTYIWNRGRQSFKIMNYEIKTIDYWPQKWNFWE
ncbi:MAG: glycosyltransferase family 39 protein [Bacteroidota bacterium]|nr:glycosyltransferase family 39 protein [Bacteroidota bacterium]